MTFLEQIDRIEPREGKPWMTLVRVRLPEHIARRPGLSDEVQKNLGRACVLQTVDNVIGIGYLNEGASFEEAVDDRSLVTANLLGILDRGPRAVIVNQMIFRDLVLSSPIAASDLTSNV